MSFNPFWESELAGTKDGAFRAMSRSAHNWTTVMKLNDRSDRLTIACMAIWSILKEKLQFSEEELFKRMQEIDLKDGKLDGRIRSQVKECTSCKRVMSQSHQKCIWCGGDKLIRKNSG